MVARPDVHFSLNSFCSSSSGMKFSQDWAITANAAKPCSTTYHNYSVSSWIVPYLTNHQIMSFSNTFFSIQMNLGSGIQMSQIPVKVKLKADLRIQTHLSTNEVNVYTMRNMLQHQWTEVDKLPTDGSIAHAGADAQIDKYLDNEYYISNIDQSKQRISIWEHKPTIYGTKWAKHKGSSDSKFNQLKYVKLCTWNLFGFWLREYNRLGNAFDQNISFLGEA